MVHDEAALASVQQHRLDTIVMDVMMPKLGEPIVVKLSLTNTGKHIVPWEAWTSETPYMAFQYGLLSPAHL